MLCWASVQEDEVAIIENCGRYNKIGDPGCHCLPVPFICSIRQRLSIRLRPLTVHCETKTKDNVFVLIVVCTQYRIIKEKAELVVYTYENPRNQIKTYVADIVRASVPKMFLDQVFESKDDIAKDILTDMKGPMEDCGYEIVDTLVVDIRPDPRVKAAMNEVNAQKRLRIAAEQKAEMRKMKTIKAAEASAESDYLSGVGLARAHRQIIGGLESSVQIFRDDLGTDAQTTMELLLASQYFDTLKDVSKGPRTRTILYNEEDEHPETDHMRMAMLQAQSAKR